MAKKPTVSILCLSFNQKDYIVQTIESFLMQKTSFDFEILIHDDASTDGTADIIRGYAEKYPTIVRPILRDENLYSQGLRNFVTRYLLPIAQGKYVALCEGDDYWTDPEKLQMQVDFLEKHPNYAVCFHPVRVVFENGEEPDQTYPSEDDPSKFTLKKLLQGNYIQTNSVMFRKQTYNSVPLNVMPADWYMHLYHAQFGKIGFINRVMSVYRRHEGGIWWDSHKNQENIWRKYSQHYLTLYVEFMRMYGDKPEYKKIIDVYISDLFDRLIELDKKYQENNLLGIITKSPEHTELYIRNQSARFKKASKKLEITEQDIAGLNQVLRDIKMDLAHKEAELQRIKQSKAWRMRNKLARAAGKEVV